MYEPVLNVLKRSIDGQINDPKNAVIYSTPFICMQSAIYTSFFRVNFNGETKNM